MIDLSSLHFNKTDCKHRIKLGPLVDGHASFSQLKRGLISSINCKWHNYVILMPKCSLVINDFHQQWWGYSMRCLHRCPQCRTTDSAWWRSWHIHCSQTITSATPRVMFHICEFFLQFSTLVGPLENLRVLISWIRFY